ncbi:MAG TPA: hypothetical protein ENG31_00975 [Candidatus Thorarchaeota archaeon]|nr:MAG: hypothetical protein DRO93_13620 [Candidatus Thorarchaeota archaeon]HDD67177.1 hypothetical protein [Candidatus Thorarchaeota archaeon]
MHNQSAVDVLQLLKELLKDLSNNSPILGAAIFSIEGLPLVSYFHTNTEEVSVAAVVASAYAAGEQTVRELRQGDLRSIIIQGTMGTSLVISIPGGYLLTVTAPENAKLGLIFNDAKRAAREASRLMQELS